MIERTFSIIKPDAVARNLTGEILAMIQENGLTIKAMKMIRMTPEQAEGFYGSEPLYQGSLLCRYGICPHEPGRRLSLRRTGYD